MVIYNEPIWNPMDLLKRFLAEGGAGNRTGVFFIAAAFALAQLGTNIAANSVSAGSDTTALLPRFMYTPITHNTPPPLFIYLDITTNTAPPLVVISAVEATSARSSAL